MGYITRHINIILMASEILNLLEPKEKLAHLIKPTRACNALDNILFTFYDLLLISFV